MRIATALIALAVLVVTVSGCANMIMPTSSFSDPIGPGKYNLRVYQGKDVNMYKKWEDEGARICGGKKFTTKDRQYVKNPDGLDYLIGVIECKQ